MILFTRRLMPAELRLQSDRETQMSGIYLANRTLTGKPDLCLPLSSDIAKRFGSLRGHQRLRSHAAPKLYFTNRTLTGTKSLFPVTSEAGNRCRLAIAAPSPSIFHQSQFDWDQESLRLGTENRQPMPIVHCSPVAKYFSPVTL